MSYITTKIKPLKSFPTYQLHAFTTNKKLNPNTIFNICILEVAKWMRSRLSDFNSIPKELMLPEPDDFESLDENLLSSFTANIGFQISVIYLPKKKMWSFHINETDSGANIGTDRERLPVNGRSFNTDISFIQKTDCVEVAVRTICTEPIDTEAPCETFRPSFVKGLAFNKNVGLKYGNYINDKSIKVESKSEADHLVELIQDGQCDIPIVIVTQPPNKNESSKPKLSTEEIFKNIENTMLNSNLTAKTTFSFITDLEPEKPKQIELDMSKADIPELKVPAIFTKMYKGEINKIKEKYKSFVKEHDKAKTSENSKNSDEPSEICETIDYNKLAEKMLSFAFIYYLPNEYFSILKNKLHISFDNGDIIVMNHAEMVEHLKYKDFKDNLLDISTYINKSLKTFHNHTMISYGSAVFFDDMTLIELNEHNNEKMSLQDRYSLVSQENETLKKKLMELEQIHIDRRATNDEMRILKKQIADLEEENQELQDNLNFTLEEHRKIRDAYVNVNRITEFYKNKVHIAALYPLHKDDICDWAEREFSDTLIISGRAKSELKKYSGNLDITMFCDGLLFLHKYSLYRRNLVKKEELALYAIDEKWDVQFCGRDTVRVYSDDYTVKIDNKKYILDYHIKHGINATQLIRIYFCWDKNTKKVLIGSMPEHLPTIKKST